MEVELSLAGEIKEGGLEEDKEWRLLENKKKRV